MRLGYLICLTTIRTTHQTGALHGRRRVRVCTNIVWARDYRLRGDSHDHVLPTRRGYLRFRVGICNSLALEMDTGPPRAWLLI